MRFTRGLQSTLMRPYPLGYEAQSTDDINNDDPRCLMGGLKDPGVWLEDKVFPATIELQIRTIPVWIDNYKGKPPALLG